MPLAAGGAPAAGLIRRVAITVTAATTNTRLACLRIHPAICLSITLSIAELRSFQAFEPRLLVLAFSPQTTIREGSRVLLPLLQRDAGAGVRETRAFVAQRPVWSPRSGFLRDNDSL